MSHTMTFTKTGKTITPTSGVSRVLNYNIGTPQLSATEVLDAYQDGGDVTNVTRRNVSESVELILRPTGSNDMSEVETFIQDLEVMFLEAERYQKDNGGAQWFVNFTPQDTTGTWRSEILAGSVHVPQESVRDWAIGDNAIIYVSLVRRFYWEGALTELEIYNPASSTPATGGKGITNQLDSGNSYYHYVDCDSEDIDTIIPTPIRLELTSSYSGGRIYDIHVGQLIFSPNRDNLTYVYEAEDASANGSPGTLNNTEWSGGTAEQYLNVTQYTYASFMWKWELTSTPLIAAAGRRYKILAKVETATSPNTGFHAKVEIWLPYSAFLNKIAETGEVYLADSDGFVDMGTLVLPPWLPNEADYYPLGLGFTFADFEEIGTKDFTLDALYVMPADHYRFLDCYSYGIENGERIVDDGITGRTFVDGWTANTDGVLGYYTGIGEPLMLWPGKDQRFVIISDSHVLATSTVRIYYRPRRLTV